MNDKFLELPEEKRLRIINAGFEVFSRSPYKRASTDDIAAKAGISKGLLFYYFQNKKSLYLYLFDYAVDFVTKHVVDGPMLEITDFFELFEHAARRKYALLQVSPFILDFIMRAYYSKGEDVSDDISRRVTDAAAASYMTYFTKIDFSKFKGDVEPTQIFKMLLWLGDGYLYNRQRMNRPFDLDDLMEQFESWMALFKKISYKEEFLQ